MKVMLSKVFLSLIITSFSANVMATDFQPNLNLKGDQYKLSGSALLEYGIFGIDIYKIAYYQATPEKSLMILHYERDIAKKYSIEGWKAGFVKNVDMTQYQEAINWFYENTPDIKKGDRLFLLKNIQNNTNQVAIIHNDKLVAKASGEKLAKLIHIPWIGPKPVDEGIKKKLFTAIESK